MNLAETLKRAVEREHFVDIGESSSIRRGYPSIIFNNAVSRMQRLGYHCYVIKLGDKRCFKILTDQEVTPDDIVIELLQN